MTFVLLIYDLKNYSADINTSEVKEYKADTITPTLNPHLPHTQNIFIKEHQTEIRSKIKSAMHAKGYSSMAHTTKTHLPHNCLVKDNTSQQQAIADLIEVTKKHNAALESYIAVTVAGSYQADASLL